MQIPNVCLCRQICGLSHIAFINAYFQFLLEYSYFVYPTKALAKATYLRVCFRCYKGGTGKIQERTFRRFLAYILSFCPLLSALCALDCWNYCNLDALTSIYCYQNMKVVTFINDYLVINNLREATLQAYPNPNHFYNPHLKYVCTYSV